MEVYMIGKIVLKKSTKKEELETIANDTEENDDWMKTLSGYKDEVAIHEGLKKKLTGRVKTVKKS